MLGDVRNLDVAREILRRVVKENPHGPQARAARRYSSHLAREAREARARLVENLRLYKCEPLERGLGDLQGSFKIHPSAPLSREMVRAVLLRRMAAVFGLKSKALAPSNETAQHRLRIALKKTRYRIEVLDFAFGETGARILTKIQGLQDVLGNLHDLDVLLGNLREWARQNSLEAKHPGASKDLDALAAHLLRKRNALHRAFARRFRPLERRRLLADLMNDLRL
jgi:CHAD domain-containing protein